MSFKPSSLAQLFEHNKYQGMFGWLCGYSADVGFLEDAVERFSGLTRAQRAHQGKIMLAVMLDPGNPQILPAQVPGVLHLPAKSPKLPFLLLHAKVAVLGFRNRDEFFIRVIVTTGNWTRQTLEESLDLAWHIDVGTAVEDKTVEMIRQERTDSAAAWSFLTSLRLHFDTRPLEIAKQFNSESGAAVEKAESWAVNMSAPHRGYRPRFFDNRERSLFQQLPDMVRVHAGHIARNYLALGSGFYESTHSGSSDIPEKIFEVLRKSQLVTSSCRKRIFVNPLACQSIATCSHNLASQDWVIRSACVPAYFGSAPRTLHAKFIFSANRREESNNCTSPWIYLGSGNLTNPGFKERAGDRGNLEAGVIFAPGNLKWERLEGDDNDNVVADLLPIRQSCDEGETILKLAAGEDMADRGAAFVAAPIALFLWLDSPNGQRLSPQGKGTGPIRCSRSRRSSVRALRGRKLQVANGAPQSGDRHLADRGR